jgi:hypothetical protein
VLQARCTFGHNSFVLNEHFDAAGVVDRSKVNDTVVIDEREIDTGFRDLRDPYHLTTGGALGRVHKNFTTVKLSGRILVPNASPFTTMGDRERAMLAAFDPALCYRDSPTTEGAYAFDFAEPTTDTATYPTGLISMRYYARPAARPKVTEQLNDGTYRKFALGLIAADPRAYEQTEQTLVLSPGTASGNVVNRGTVPSALKATIVMAGAGSATFTITRSGVAFILNLSTMVNTDTVVVLFETSGPYGTGKLITKNGASAFSLKTSAPSTWLDAPVGTTSFAISNTTNVTSCTLAWRSARA